MIEVLFFIQYRSMGSSSRGIQSGGKILYFGDLCDEQYIRSICKGRYKFMYQVGREHLKDMKSMSLSEFEAIFYPKGYLGTLKNMQYLLGFSDLESPFRKEILEKYGALANKVKPRTTIVYKPGQIIKGVDDVEYVYVGLFEEISFTIDRSLWKTISGHMYIPVQWIVQKYGSTVPNESSSDMLCEYLMRYLNNYSKLKKYFLKTKRKAIGINANTQIMNMNWITESGGSAKITKVAKRNMMYSYDRKVEIEIKYKTE